MALPSGWQPVHQSRDEKTVDMINNLLQDQGIPDARGQRRGSVDGSLGVTGTAAGLFSGIGGLELGLESAGFETELLCEIDPGARAVLEHRMPRIEIASDVRTVRSLPKVDVLVAGFPCQDLSQAGTGAGIRGSQSGLVDEIFRLLHATPVREWVVLENVPFMLQLDRGQAMRHLTDALEGLGYWWAYRVVDARSFGLPQRRLRVVLVASRTNDPRDVLFVDDAGERPATSYWTDAAGFYWTEGTRGLGWAPDAVPTLKGGSSIGIASPPGVWLPGHGQIVTPSIIDAERLQGFAANWTVAAEGVRGIRRQFRWKLVGNAVNVRMAKWLGSRLANPESHAAETSDSPVGGPWPTAAWGGRGQQYRVHSSAWPQRQRYEHLSRFVREWIPLSARATAGFLKRAEASRLRFADGFLDDVRAHLSAVVSGAEPAEQTSPATARI